MDWRKYLPIAPTIRVLSGRWFLSLASQQPRIVNLLNPSESEPINAADVAEIRGSLDDMPGWRKCYGTRTAIRAMDDPGIYRVVGITDDLAKENRR